MIFKFLNAIERLADNLAEKMYRASSPKSEEVRIVECADGLFRPQILKRGSWQFVMWEGCDLGEKTIDEAKATAQRYISPNAFPEYRKQDPAYTVKNFCS